MLPRTEHQVSRAFSIVNLGVAVQEELAGTTGFEPATSDVTGIARCHHGGVSVQSAKGVGSTFTVFFPVVAGAHDVSVERVSSDPLLVLS